MLVKVSIQQYLSQAVGKALAKARITPQEIIQHAAEQLRFDPKDVLTAKGRLKDLSKLPEPVRKALQVEFFEQHGADGRVVRSGRTVKAGADRYKYLDMLAKILKLYNPEAPPPPMEGENDTIVFVLPYNAGLSNPGPPPITHEELDKRMEIKQP